MEDKKLRVGVLCAIALAAVVVVLGAFTRLVDAGLGNRLMYGSDAGVWPDAIRLSIEALEAATFLTPTQRRDILYNNAARFLRLRLWSR